MTQKLYSSTDSLPPVATKVYAYCPKCETDRYFRVLAHSAKSSARVECEVCGRKKTLKFEADPNAPEKKPRKARATPKKTAAETEAMEEYQRLKETYDPGKTIGYRLNDSFLKDQSIDHPRFGIGFVMKATDDRIEVLFEDKMRALIHRRDNTGV